MDSGNVERLVGFLSYAFQGIPDSTWWIDRLLPVLNADTTTRQLAWVLVWRNAYHENLEGHFFAPYPGHASADTFAQFRNNPLLLFEEDLPELYERP